MSPAVVVGLAALAFMALSGLLLFVRRAPDAVKSVKAPEVGGALRELAALGNESAVIKLDGGSPDDHFEVRFVEDQFRFEYQVVTSGQLNNEQNIRSAFASLRYECMEWGDGSDGWDKYIFVEIGADPAVALHRIDDLLRACSRIGLDVAAITLQDFVRSGVVV